MNKDNGKSLVPDGVLRQVILKVVQRCNLNCTYCYVYNRGDDSWKHRPGLISEKVVDQLILRINEHCEAYNLSGFTVELHGGEPLLLGKSKMRSILDRIQRNCQVTVHFTMQTNGLLLDRDWIALFEEFQVSFGISIDGPPKFADEFRILRKDGSGSTSKVLEIVQELRKETSAFDELLGGCLCVINPKMKGADLVDWFVSKGFRGLERSISYSLTVASIIPLIHGVGLSLIQNFY